LEILIAAAISSRVDDVATLLFNSFEMALSETLPANRFAN
jgi:hypothetical protein